MLPTPPTAPSPPAPSASSPALRSVEEVRHDWAAALAHLLELVQRAPAAFEEGLRRAESQVLAVERDSAVADGSATVVPPADGPAVRLGALELETLQSWRAHRSKGGVGPKRMAEAPAPAAAVLLEAAAVVQEAAQVLERGEVGVVWASHHLNIPLEAFRGLRAEGGRAGWDALAARHNLTAAQSREGLAAVESLSAAKERVRHLLGRPADVVPLLARRVRDAAAAFVARDAALRERVASPELLPSAVPLPPVLVRPAATLIDAERVEQLSDEELQVAMALLTAEWSRTVARFLRPLRQSLNRARRNTQPARRLEHLSDLVRRGIQLEELLSPGPAPDKNSAAAPVRARELETVRSRIAQLLAADRRLEADVAVPAAEHVEDLAARAVRMSGDEKALESVERDAGLPIAQLMQAASTLATVDQQLRQLRVEERARFDAVALPSPDAPQWQQPPPAPAPVEQAPQPAAPFGVADADAYVASLDVLPTPALARPRASATLVTEGGPPGPDTLPPAALRRVPARLGPQAASTRRVDERASRVGLLGERIVFELEVQKWQAAAQQRPEHALALLEDVVTRYWAGASGWAAAALDALRTAPSPATAAAVTRLLWPARAELGDQMGFDLFGLEADGTSWTCVEVKATEGDATRPFELTANEYRTALREGDRYLLVRVSRMRVRPPAVRYWRNPAALLATGSLSLSPTRFSAVLRPAEDDEQSGQ